MVWGSFYNDAKVTQRNNEGINNENFHYIHEANQVTISSVQITRLPNCKPMSYKATRKITKMLQQLQKLQHREIYGLKAHKNLKRGKVSAGSIRPRWSESLPLDRNPFEMDIYECHNL